MFREEKGEARRMGRQGRMPRTLISPSEAKRRRANQVGSGERIPGCTEDPSRGRAPSGVDRGGKIKGTVFLA